MGVIRSSGYDVRIKNRTDNIPAGHFRSIQWVHPNIYAGIAGWFCGLRDAQGPLAPPPTMFRAMSHNMIALEPIQIGIQNNELTFARAHSE